MGFAYVSTCREAHPTLKQPRAPYDKHSMNGFDPDSDDFDPESTGVLRAESVTVADLFTDLVRTETDEVLARVDELPTDVMLLEGAGALIDASAALRYVAARLARPGSDEAAGLLALADTLTEQAARFQHAGDSVAIAIRASGERPRADA